ncbi:MAG TPA: YdeI/OmpD-associated family protein [Acidobacteriaceae bacterium]|jgi:uncharacterized protein YdeI (YjbR/CyaY-like superfamily)|nr:YdeI/OmpD-associated family protein [Acidobacteriaceae bacterium]
MLFRMTPRRPATESRLPAIDAYIAAAAPFAQPILSHIRELVHKAVPEVEEAIKWSHPFFVYRGIILGNMAAFKQHCSLGFWGPEIAAKLREDGLYSREGMGVLGQLKSLEDLPGDRELLSYLRAGAKVIDDGTRTRSVVRAKGVPKPPPEVPAALAAALKKNKAAAKQFDAMPPGSQREYCDWIADAKREETRDKRLATAMEWIAEGKRRNWQYEARG